MRSSITFSRASALVLWVACGCAAHAGPLNLFEWSAVSPIVAEGEIVGEEGRYTALVVNRVLRGSVLPQTKVLIHTRLANRDRSPNADLKALRFEAGMSYLVLLEVDGDHQSGPNTVYRLVRGVQGARILPPEGAPAILDALQQFIEIQDAKNENETWRRFTGMLEEANPVLLENALDQFLKFRRGTPQLLPAVLPLLEHPGPALRERAALLVGQVVSLERGQGLPEEETLRAQLFARARRDPEVAVRVAACQALEGFADRGVGVVLEEIAESDPDQLVRYIAEKLLFDRRSREPARAGVPGRPPDLN